MARARGSHPFPSRTRKLSLSAPMVLGTRVPGRVGRRRISHTRAALRGCPCCVLALPRLLHSSGLDGPRYGRRHGPLLPFRSSVRPPAQWVSRYGRRGSPSSWARRAGLQRRCRERSGRIGRRSKWSRSGGRPLRRREGCAQGCAQRRVRPKRDRPAGRQPLRTLGRQPLRTLGRPTGWCPGAPGRRSGADPARDGGRTRRRRRRAPGWWARPSASRRRGSAFVRR